MPLVKVDFAPGVNKEGTRYTNENQYYDSDKTRFRKGRPESIGGWEKYTPNTFQGVCRSIFHWHRLNGTKYYTIGTNLKYYLLDANVFADITPIRVAAAGLASNPFTTVNESTTVIVADSSHGAEEGDFVTIASAATTRGIPAAELNKEHQIVTVPGTGTYTISVDTAATSSGTGGGTTPPTVEYQVNTGLEIAVLGPGWGAGTWGRGTWDSDADRVAHGILRIWHQDKFGEDLVFNIRDGALYFWNSSDGTGTRGTLLSAESGASQVPTVVRQVLVSQVDRHVIAYGANPKGSSTQDPLLIRWSTQESAVDWNPTATTTAGDFRLTVGSQIVGALQTANGEILVWTDEAIYAQQYIGPPYTFGFKLLSGGLDLAGPNAAAFMNGLGFWMGVSNFYVYSGSVKSLPCTLLDHVFNDINIGESSQFFAAPNSGFNEISWFYCSHDSPSIDRYVTHNYEDGTWYPGTLERSAWIDATDTEYPLATEVTGGILYKHEYGVDADGSALNSYIESSDFDIGEGDKFMFVSRIVPDVDFSNGTSGVSQTGNMILKTRNYPGNPLTTNSTSAITDTTEQAFIRARARQAVLRWETNTIGVAWRMGVTRMDMKPDGGR